MQFKDWFFQQFPDAIQSSDTYKNAIGEGVFQRYLRNYGLELDEEIVIYIRDFTDIIDVQKCDEKYLPLIATILGGPPTIGVDSDLYRKVLAYALAIYKVKGTKRAYQILFSLLGISVSLVQEIPRRVFTYDMDVIGLYDESPVQQYDSSCQYCSYYWIAYSQDNNPVEPEILENLQSVLCFLQPINAKFGGFVRMLKFEDQYTITALGDFFNIELL